MKRETITRMLNDIDDRFVSEAAFPDPASAREGPERIKHMKKKRIITLALAAALILGLGVAAYAGGWFDRKQVVIVDRPIVLSQDPGPAEIEITDDEPAETPRVLTPTVPEEVRRVSVTQPLVVPDDLDPETYARASNTAAATNEFLAWYIEQEAQNPAPADPMEILNKRAEQGWEALTEEEQQIILDWNKETTKYHERMFAEQNRVKSRSWKNTD